MVFLRAKYQTIKREHACKGEYVLYNDRCRPDSNACEAPFPPIEHSRFLLYQPEREMLRNFIDCTTAVIKHLNERNSALLAVLTVFLFEYQACRKNAVLLRQSIENNVLLK